MPKDECNKTSVVINKFLNLSITAGALVVVTVSRGMICPVMGRVVDGFCTTYLFVKYIRQKKVSSMMKVKVFEEIEYDKSFHYLNQL